MKFFAQCSKSQQDLVRDEVINLNLDPILIGGGVEFQASLEEAYKFVLSTRFSTRLLLAITSLENIDSSDALYNAALNIDWENYMDIEDLFLVTCTVQNSKWLTNSHHGVLKVKDAIVDRFRNISDERPSIDLDNPKRIFHLHLYDNFATFYFDFSGRSLYKRSYKSQSTTATLKEDLAAAILYRSGFLKDIENKVDFYDPFCGSGTLAIEAALIAKNIAPGLLRKDSFSFISSKFYDEKLYNKVIKELEEQRKDKLDIKIFASDIDPYAIEISKANAQRAMVLDDINFFEFDFLQSNEIKKNIHIISDPPYGNRLGSKSETYRLFSSLREILENYYPGSLFSIISEDPTLLSALALKPERTNLVYNAGKEHQIAHYRLFSLEEREMMKMRKIQNKKDRMTRPLSKNQEMIFNRLVKNLKAIKPLMLEQGISCYRVYDADMPEYNAAIDIYEDRYLVVNEYAPPKTIDASKAEERLSDLVFVSERVFDIDLDFIFVKKRKVNRGYEQYDKFDDSNKFYMIKENSLFFMVNFTDYLDTGVFLDHRPIRAKIMQMAANKRFLNLFCYTGTATLAAAKGGCLSSVSVDTSGTYLDWANKNMENNNLATMNHIYYKEDAINYLKQTYDVFDLIFCDPPTFSNTKKKDRVFDVQRDHKFLIKMCLKRLSKNGILIFSNNFKKFQLDESLYDFCDIEDISEESIPDDFKASKKIHSCFLIKHKIRTIKKRT